MNSTKYGNNAFYTSQKWRRVATAYMSSKSYICERCGAPAVICHHKQWLDDKTVHDPSIALSFDNLEALCIECHNAEHGLRHDITVFDSDGNVAEVKESAATKKYQSRRSQIDDVVRKAKSLLCGLNENEPDTDP